MISSVAPPVLSPMVSFRLLSVFCRICGANIGFINNKGFSIERHFKEHGIRFPLLHKPWRLNGFEGHYLLFFDDALGQRHWFSRGVDYPKRKLIEIEYDGHLLIRRLKNGGR